MQNNSPTDQIVSPIVYEEPPIGSPTSYGYTPSSPITQRLQNRSNQNTSNQNASNESTSNQNTFNQYSQSSVNYTRIPQTGLQAKKTCSRSIALDEFAKIREKQLVLLAIENRDLFCNYPYLFQGYSFGSKDLITNFQRALKVRVNENQIGELLDQVLFSMSYIAECDIMRLLVWAVQDPIVARPIMRRITELQKFGSAYANFLYIAEASGFGAEQVQSYLMKYTNTNLYLYYDSTRQYSDRLVPYYDIVWNYMIQNTESVCTLCNCVTLIDFFGGAKWWDPILWLQLFDYAKENESKQELDTILEEAFKVIDFAVRLINVATDEQYEELKRSDLQSQVFDPEVNISYYKYAANSNLRNALRRIFQVSGDGGGGSPRQLPRKCFDPLNLKKVQIDNYLNSTIRGVVIYVEPKSLANRGVPIQVGCSSFEQLKISVEESIFYECDGLPFPQGLSFPEYLNEEPYVKINVNSLSFLVGLYSIRRVINESERVLYFVYERTMQRTVSQRGIIEDNFTSRNKCQEGSELDLYAMRDLRFRSL